MRQYRGGRELEEAIRECFQRYDSEFDAISEEMRDWDGDGPMKTPAQHLAYHLGWTGLLLLWEKEEKAGGNACVPAVGYRWNQLGLLYQSFYKQYEDIPLHQQRRQLAEQVGNIDSWIESLTEAELFQTGQRQWADTPAQWPVYKWIHINTVAPFTNFRMQIRRWKRFYEIPAAGGMTGSFPCIIRGNENQ